MKLSEELTQRGFINQISCESLSEIVDGQKRTIYHGIDPSADSAHAGNFVIWILLRHLANAGHKIVFLVGGGTGMIGDPKPDVERTLASLEVVQGRVSKLKAQAERLLGAELTFVNNYHWLSKINLITFLRDIGKHFTVNELIKKDAIATRLANETGLSYTEFAYPLLQAYDYLTLNREQGCDVQVGGSDQWGNIISGVDLIRRVEQKTAYALTVPLIVDKATGKKFGKSEGNAVWLDAEKTTPYAFYQFWLNASDESVIDYLKLFTFLSLEEIDRIKLQHQENPSERLAQYYLAKEVTRFVHNEKMVEVSELISSYLFGTNKSSLKELSKENYDLIKQCAPVTTFVENVNVVDALVETGLASSKREARTFVEEGAVEINSEPITDVAFIISKEQFGDLMILKRGKKSRLFIEIK